LRELTEVVPTSNPDVQKLLESLVEDVQALSRENAILRESFLRMLALLGEDSEGNIRRVEAEIRANVAKEFEVL
jgi:hypothetical protein